VTSEKLSITITMRATRAVVGFLYLFAVVVTLVHSLGFSNSAEPKPSRLGPPKTVGPGKDVKSSQKKSCSFVQGLHANLIRFITKDGFHRDLGDTLEITVTNSLIPLKSFVNGDCSFVIYSEFTNDIYVDPYEIDRDPALSSQIRVLNNWTDLENPAWQAKSNSTVFVHVKTIQTGNLISSEEIRMPIHFRYQKPISHSATKLTTRNLRVDEDSWHGFVPVNLPLPKLLLRCSTWNPRQVQDQCDTIKLICNLKSPNSKQCIWAFVPFNANTKGSTVFIPVGDSDLQVLITNSTFLVIAGGTIFLLVTLFRARQEIAAGKRHAD